MKHTFELSIPMTRDDFPSIRRAIMNWLIDNTRTPCMDHYSNPQRDFYWGAGWDLTTQFVAGSNSHWCILLEVGIKDDDVAVLFALIKDDF